MSQVFQATPARGNAPAQLLSLSAITGGSITPESSGGTIGGTVTLVNPPLSGVSGGTLVFGGALLPGGTAVRAGLSSSNTLAPSTWISATVSGTSWSASLTPSTSGSFYVWVEQASDPAIQAITGPITVTNAGTSSIEITSPPSAATVAVALVISGTVVPSDGQVQVGLSASATSAPSSWITAVVTGGTWTATITPSAAGTFYIWAELSSDSAVNVVSAAVSVGSGGGQPITYGLLQGSGDGSLSSTTLTTATAANYGPAPAIDWTTSIAANATDVEPNVIVSPLGQISTTKFWWDTSPSGTTVGTNFAKNSSMSNGVATFYASSTGYGIPTSMPVAPGTAGIYYGKYAFYDSSNNLLGIFATSAITIH